MTPKTERYTLRLSPDDLAALGELSKLLRRSRSDTVRVLVREYLDTLKSQPAPRLPMPDIKGKIR
jgi:metal-responsive CopG/Arc/MetJ family transcriptional regulator